MFMVGKLAILALINGHYDFSKSVLCEDITETILTTS